MAIINKASLVLLVLFAVATISQATRFESSLELNKHSASTSEVCSDCECKEESGVTKCYRRWTKIGGSPLACAGSTTGICALSYPPICFCTIEVETCDPPSCNSGIASALGFKDFNIRQVKP